MTIMTKQIPLTQGKVALVDDDDYDRLTAMGRWCADYSGSEWRAIRTLWNPIKRTKLYMHRVIMNPPSDAVVDHINGDSLDNRRSNLRICQENENLLNRAKPSHNTSGYKGVYWNPRRNRWEVRIKVGKTRKHLGRYVVLEDAARAYDRAAIQYFGEFARLNFPSEHSPIEG